MQVTDSLGNRYRLGDALGQGGEGVVYKIQSQPDQAAKIYHQPPPAELATKLGAMAAMATDDLRAVASWPLRVLKRLRQNHSHRLRGMHDRLTQIPGEMDRLQKKFTGLRPVLQRALNNLAQRRVIALAALKRQEAGL